MTQLINAECHNSHPYLTVLLPKVSEEKRKKMRQRSGQETGHCGQTMRQEQDREDSKPEERKKLISGLNSL